jgi:hypothetical protein
VGQPNKPLLSSRIVDWASFALLLPRVAAEAIAKARARRRAHGKPPPTVTFTMPSILARTERGGSSEP